MGTTVVRRACAISMYWLWLEQNARGGAAQQIGAPRVGWRTCGLPSPTSRDAVRSSARLGCRDTPEKSSKPHSEKHERSNGFPQDCLASRPRSPSCWLATARQLFRGGSRWGVMARISHSLVSRFQLFRVRIIGYRCPACADGISPRRPPSSHPPLNHLCGASSRCLEGAQTDLRAP